MTDAHQYLLDHFKEFDFIWSSPPCPTHSRIRKNIAVSRGQCEPIYPDMNLYQEIILLKYHSLKKWCVENVISYYSPLIKPTEICHHWFWANFHISDMKKKSREHFYSQEDLEKCKGFDLTGKNTGHRKDQVLRNCVNPYLGLHILNESKRDIQPELFRK